VISIRPEIQADFPAIYSINKLAFDGRDAEPRLVEAIRSTDTFIPELSLVAEAAGRVIGHILFSKIVVETRNESLVGISLAPMAVHPSHQNRGIGSALVQHGIEKVRALGYPFIIVLGHPWFYPRFGFSAELARTLECPFGECGEAWMALELVPGALQGVKGKAIFPSYFMDV
jgi:putative acetyltransferase